jgi:hypothetical protein
MARHSLTIEIEDFGYTELERAAREQGVSIEELVVHATMYFLADLDSGRWGTTVVRDQRESSDVAAGDRSASESAASNRS